MRDLAIATEKLKTSGDSLIVVKDGLVLLSKKGGGIGPLFDALLELGERMKGSCVADRVIGKAAAALCVFSKIKKVYTPVLSKTAVELLVNNKIIYSTDFLVPGILNKDRTGFCPLESITADMEDHREIYDAVKKFLGK